MAALTDFDLSKAERELLALIVLELTSLLAFTWGMVWYFRAPVVPKFVFGVVVSVTQLQHR